MRGAPGEAWRYVGVGLTWAGSLLLFLLLGRWADGRLGSEPVLTLVGAFVGGGAGFWYLYRELVIVPRERAAKKRSEDGR